jgi:arabinogalactan endo-1,4-beta-galactosidase
MINTILITLSLFALAIGQPGPFILGADISHTLQQEAEGRSYSDGGMESDLLEILKQHKFNWIRLRIFHNPLSEAENGAYGRSRGGPFCGLEYTIRMAKRIKAAGMSLLLDFHYSDNWADPGDQYTPLAWEGLSLEATADSLYQYTTYVLREMEKEGVLPQMVQPGNEINNGMCWPVGRELADAAVLVKRGLEAISDVSPEIKTMLHSATGGNNTASTRFMNTMLDAGCKFDALGLSCYTRWHGPPEDWEANFTQLAQDFPDHGFSIVEYPHEKRAANDIMYNLANNRGWGTFIWEPVSHEEKIFDLQNGVYYTNDLIDLYPKMHEDYDIEDVTGIHLAPIARNGNTTGNRFSLKHDNSIIIFIPSLSAKNNIRYDIRGKAKFILKNNF